MHDNTNAIKLALQGMTLIQHPDKSMLSDSGLIMDCSLLSDSGAITFVRLGQLISFQKQKGNVSSLQLGKQLMESICAFLEDFQPNPHAPGSEQQAEDHERILGTRDLLIGIVTLPAAKMLQELLKLIQNISIQTDETNIFMADLLIDLATLICHDHKKNKYVVVTLIRCTIFLKETNNCL
jgi:hypothetical protein